MLIRRETPADVPAVREVTAAAFARPDTAVPVEVSLLDELRDDACWLPALSLVAIGPEGAVLGHVVSTRGMLGGTPALGLGPISVRPDRQGTGVGSALMHAALGAADALGEPFVALLGEPEFYRRFGFRTSTEYGIAPPEAAWGTYFQVRTLARYVPDTHRGAFRYAEPFSRV